MAYETKVILKSLALHIAKAESVKEAYFAVQSMASVEGMKLEEYEDMKETLEKNK